MHTILGLRVSTRVLFGVEKVELKNWKNRESRFEKLQLGSWKVWCGKGVVRG